MPLPRRSRSHALALALALALAPLVHAGAARACMNETYEELDALAPRVAKAKKALEQGRYLDVGKAIAAVLPDLQARAAHEDDARPLLRRARILSLAATIRSNGRVVGKKTFDDESGRIARLLEAYQGLVVLKGKKKDTDELEAEVMARSANMRESARTKLEELAAKDLLTAPESWAALATLREAGGDKVGAAQAKQTCTARAADPKQCLGFFADGPGRT